MHKTQTPLKGLIFDLDGTLVDSLGLTFEAINHALVLEGSRVHTPHEIIQYFGPGEDQILADILGVEKAPQAYSSYKDYLNENLERVPLHSGVSELLNEIQKAGIPISLVTGRSWKATELILEHHALTDRFITILANDHVKRPKPDPEGIQVAVQRMGLKPHEVAYIGDTSTDVRAARSAGAHSIAALWDLLANLEEINQHGPNHLAKHPGQVLEIWKMRDV